MSKLIKKIFSITICSFLILVFCVLPLNNFTEATPPKYTQNYSSNLFNGGWVLNPDDFGIDKDQTLRKNIVSLFYPGGADTENLIYKVIRDMTLGLMIVFIVRAGASLLFNRESKDIQNTLHNFIYILLGGAFIYGANRLFGSVFNFNSPEFVSGTQRGIGGVTNALIGEKSVFFFVLSALKAAAFFFAIVMIVITGIRVIGAGEAEKGKKLVKGLINVVVALLIIKGIDFVYYLAADSENFIQNASDFIINVAKIFGYIYGVIIVIMIFIAGYLYITDGGSGDNFKKASNILVNILLSGLVLFAFLLILYQVFAEFQTEGDAVTLLLNPAMSYV